MSSTHQQHPGSWPAIRLWILVLGCCMSCQGREHQVKSLREPGGDLSPSPIVYPDETFVHPGSGKRLFALHPDDLVRIDWLPASGIGHSLVKTDGAWYYAGMEALDNKAMLTYVTGLLAVAGIPADSAMTVKGMALLEEITLHRSGESVPIVVSVYGEASTGAALMHVTSHPTDMFLTDSLGLYARIFTDLRRFWPDGQ